MSLLARLKSAGSIKSAEILSESSFFNKKDIIPTQLPILNVAFSGALDGGLVPGLSIFAGASKSFKTLLGLYCMKAYLDKYPEGIALLYDSEFGITPDYLKANGIDSTRVLHIPIEHIEQLKFDVVKRLEEIKRNDKVFILVDSLGNLASKKETEDALDEKSVADMSRAKAIRSLLRIITPHLTMKDLPCVIINHIYQTMELYSQVVIPGGTAVTYAANQIFVISKSQEKDGTDIVGWNFTINIHKSRFVKEKSKLPFLVTYEGGINKWSGLLDIAMNNNVVVKPSNGWYSRVDLETGEVEAKKWRLAETNNKEFWQPILTNKKFHEMVKNTFQVSTASLITDEELDSEILTQETEDEFDEV
ncbi:MAG: recombinase RecA [Proteobacteria bacterium]|nr:recombinase RecA [Pseudomonadota bacterium]